MSGEADWLDIDKSNSVEDPQKVEQRAKALDFARLYQVFALDPRGRELLAFWDKTLRRRRIAVNSSIQEYAAHAALRDFVEGIHQQIEFAETEGKLP